MAENPVAVVRSTGQDNRLIYKSVYTFCPGCKAAHPFRVELSPDCPPRKDGSSQPIWDWDGNLEAPTFSPSMLAYGSVHLCPPEYVHHTVCEDPDSCEVNGHLIISEEPRVLGHQRQHVSDPAWGNCHSFLKAGRWEFLSDSAHALAGKTTDMIPLPDWML